MPKITKTINQISICKMCWQTIQGVSSSPSSIMEHGAGRPTHFMSHQTAESHGQGRECITAFHLLPSYAGTKFYTANFILHLFWKRCSINAKSNLQVKKTTRRACLRGSYLTHLNNIRNKVWQRLVHFNLLRILLDLVFLGVQFMTYPTDLRLHDLKQ